MWEAKWLSVGALENIKVCRHYLGQMAKKTKTKIQNRTGWLVNGTSLLQIAIFGIHLSQMDVWNKARKLETFHLTDDIANGLKDKLSKTEHSYGVFKLSRMSSKGSRLASETKWLLLHPSIHPFILLSWVSQASAPTRRTPSVPVCHLDWHHPPRVKPHPCWISHTPAPRVQIRLFFFHSKGIRRRRKKRLISVAHKGACVLHVAQAAKMGKIHWASHLILLHHLPTWQCVFLVLVVYLVEPRQSPALREEHMQSDRLEHLTNQNHNLSLFSHTGPLSEMLLFWNQWHPWGVAAMDESGVASFLPHSISSGPIRCP